MRRRHKDLKSRWKNSEGWLMLSLLRRWLWEKMLLPCRWGRLSSKSTTVDTITALTHSQQMLLLLCFLLRPGCNSRQPRWSRSWTRWQWWWEDLDYWRYRMTRTRSPKSKLPVCFVCLHIIIAHNISIMWSHVCLFFFVWNLPFSWWNILTFDYML